MIAYRRRDGREKMGIICKNKPLFINKKYGGDCEQDGSMCAKCNRLFRENLAIVESKEEAKETETKEETVKIEISFGSILIKIYGK